MSKEKDILTLDFNDLSNINEGKLQMLRDTLARECQRREWERVLKGIPKPLKKLGSSTGIKGILEKYILDVAENKIDSRERFYDQLFTQAIYMFYGPSLNDWVYNTVHPQDYY